MSVVHSEENSSVCHYTMKMDNTIRLILKYTYSIGIR